MYSQFLVKKAVGLGDIGDMYNAPYSYTLAQQQPMQQAQMPVGLQELIAAWMMRPSDQPKRQNSFYDYIMANPDRVSDAQMWDEFQYSKPEYAKKMMAARDALLDASGKGLFNLQDAYKGYIDPNILRDAFLAEPRMDNKMAMLDALKREDSPEAKKAIQMIQESNLVDPSQREKWWRPEPGKQSVLGNIKRIRGVDPSRISGTPQYKGGGSKTWGSRGYNSTVDSVKSTVAPPVKGWYQDFNDWLNQRNSPAKREALKQSQAPVTATNQISYNPYSTPPRPTTFNPIPQNNQIGYNPYHFNTGYNTNGKLPGAPA